MINRAELRTTSEFFFGRREQNLSNQMSDRKTDQLQYGSNSQGSNH